MFVSTVSTVTVICVLKSVSILIYFGVQCTFYSIAQCVHSISVYKEAQVLCKQYENASGNAVGEVRPAKHPFFQKLGPIIDLRLQKSERENGFM